MPHINFLEKKKFSLTEFQKFEMNYFWMMVMVGVLALVCILYGLIQRYRVGSVQVKVDVIEAEIKQLSGVPAAKPGTPEKPGFLDPLTQRVRWAPVLSEVASHTPEAVWLKTIQGSAVGGRRVKIGGWSADVISVAHFERELTEVPLFRKVQLLQSLDKETEGGQRQLEFELDTWLK